MHFSLAFSNYKLKKIHSFSIRLGVPLTSTDMGKHLIFKLFSLSTTPPIMSYAHQIFTQIQNPNIFTWNTMIRGYDESENSKPEIDMYQVMHLNSIRPDTHTYPFLLKAITWLMDVGEGEKVHSIGIRNGFESFVFVQNNLLHMYVASGHAESAHKGFEKMLERNLVMWNSVINGVALNGRPNEALTLYREMEMEGVELDGFTMVSLLTACAKLGALALGRTHAYMLKVGLNENC